MQEILQNAHPQRQRGGCDSIRIHSNSKIVLQIMIRECIVYYETIYHGNFLIIFNTYNSLETRIWEKR